MHAKNIKKDVTKNNTKICISNFIKLLIHLFFIFYLLS